MVASIAKKRPVIGNDLPVFGNGTLVAWAFPWDLGKIARATPKQKVSKRLQRKAAV